MAVKRDKKYEGISAESIRFQGENGDWIDGYLARPLGNGPFPGIILIHEVWGLVTHTKEMAHKYASEGFIVLAPDLYSRESIFVADPADLRSALQAMGGVPDSRAIGDFEGAAQTLKSLPYCNGKIGCTGHCSGGRHTALFACNTSSLSAAVSCYGGRIIQDGEVTENMPVQPFDMLKDLSCPILGLFGEDDANPSPDHAARIEAELKKLNKAYEFHTYMGDVGHGFFADYRPSYRQEAAVDGWKRAFDFFSKYLK